MTDISVKVQLQTVPKKTSFHRSSIDQGRVTTTSRVQQFEGLLIIKPDPFDDMGLVDIDASLFTAHNEQLAAVDAEMKRLRALSPQQPRPVRSRSRERPEPDDTDAPSSRRQRRAV